MGLIPDVNSFVERTNERTGPAWHGTTKLFYTPDQLVTCEQMVIDANGDFPIAKAPLYAGIEGGLRMKLDGQFAIMRGPTVNDNKWISIGTCSEDFAILDNVSLAKMLDRQLSKQWPAETCGVMENGATVFLVLKVGEYNLLDLKDEHNTTFVMVYHDKRPGGGLHFTLSEVRTVCQNTVEMAITEAQLHIKLKQTGGFIERLESVMDLSSELQKLQFASREVLEKLAQTRVTSEEATALIAKGYTDPPKPGSVKLMETAGITAVESLGERGEWMLKRDRAYKLALARTEQYRLESYTLYDKICDEFPAIGGTAYAVVQAVAEHADYRHGKGDIVASRVFGDRADVKKRALTAAVGLLSRS